MRAFDDAVLKLLRTGPQPLIVLDGWAEPDRTDPKVISLPLPYVVYTSTMPADEARTYFGDASSQTIEFDLMYVGRDRNQAKAAGERAHQRITGRSVLPGAGALRRADSMPVGPDPDYRSPDGRPLFYGVSRYAVTLPT